MSSPLVEIRRMISFGHLILLLVILLLFFGPTRIEGVGTALGRAVRGFKKGLDGADLDEKPKSSTTTTEPNEVKV